MSEDNQPQVRVGDLLPEEQGILLLTAAIQAVRGESDYSLTITAMHDPHHQRVWMLALAPKVGADVTTIGAMPLAFMHEDMLKLVSGLHAPSADGSVKGIDLVETLDDMAGEIGAEVLSGALADLFRGLREAQEDGTLDRVAADNAKRKNAPNN